MSGTVTLTIFGVKTQGHLENASDRGCSDCGSHLVDLGELDSAHAGRVMCSAVVAYAVELARRGDNRPVDHALMRADGERAALHYSVKTS